MKKYLIAMSSVAFALMFVTPPKFCQGIRVAQNDNISYSQFIDDNAVNGVDCTAKGMADPAVRDLCRRTAKTWKGQVSAGQVVFCGKSTL